MVRPVYITIDMYKCLVKTYTLFGKHMHATVDLSVCVFSTDMHSSSLGARPGGFLCRLNYLDSLHSTSIIT